mgnify:CR=1 FL=1
MRNALDEAEKARSASKAMFTGGDASQLEATIVGEENFRDGVVDILQLLVAGGLCASRGEARRAVEQGGVSVNGEKVADPKTLYTKDSFAEEFILKKGKKKILKVEI